MILSYLGGQFIKMQFGDKVIALNPISKDSKLKTTKFGADIAAISVNHPDFNGTDQLVFGDRKPFTVSGPGEYEIKEVFIKGFPSKTNYGGNPSTSSGQGKNNTVYSIVLEGMTVLHLGALSDAKNLSKEALENAEEGVDVLLTPINGNGVLNVAEAYKLAVNLEAKIIIPLETDEKLIKNFLKEGGDEGVKPIDKLTLKKKDLEGKNGDIVILGTSI